MLAQDLIEQFDQLPEHKKILSRLIEYFSRTSSIDGIILSGSLARGNMDQHSDIDLGLVFQAADQRDLFWKRRWDLNIAPWYHRFDADHIKSYFTIYFFEPDIKVDLSYYLKDELPGKQAGPYKIAFDKHADLLDWAEKTNREHFAWVHSQDLPSLKNLDHEDERFWAWVNYALSHIARGEFYEIAHDFSLLRNQLHKLVAYFHKQESFNSRRLEERDLKFCHSMQDCFPSNGLGPLKRSLNRLIENYLEYRQLLTEHLQVQWTTSERTIKKICSLAKDLHPGSVARRQYDRVSLQ